MIISDLQYIESVDTSEIQGGSGYYKKPDYKKGGKAQADAYADASAYGKYTYAYTNTYAVADAGKYSGASSSSSAYASNKWY